MRLNWLGWTWVAWACVAQGSAWADPARDRQQAMTVQARESTYDGRQQAGRFTGDVVLTQGGLSIHADQIDVQVLPNGSTVAQATGQPARFTQKGLGTDSVSGSAQRIRYDTASDTVRFTGDARIQRQSAGQVADETRGAEISYHVGSQQFRVAGSGAAGSAGMTRTVISPRATGSSRPAPSPRSDPPLQFVPLPPLNPP